MGRMQFSVMGKKIFLMVLLYEVGGIAIYLSFILSGPKQLEPASILTVFGQGFWHEYSLGTYFWDTIFIIFLSPLYIILMAKIFSLIVPSIINFEKKIVKKESYMARLPARSTLSFGDYYKKSFFPALLALSLSIQVLPYFIIFFS